MERLSELSIRNSKIAELEEQLSESHSRVGAAVSALTDPIPKEEEWPEGVNYKTIKDHMVDIFSNKKA